MMKPAIWIATLLLVCIAGCAEDEPDLPEPIEVTAEAEQTVVPNGRTVVLEHYSGAVTVSGRNDSTALFRLTKRATGRGEAEAQRLLDGIAVETEEDAETVAVRLASEAPDSTAVGVRAEVPFKTPVRVMLGDGAVDISAMTGAIAVEVANGAVTIKGAARDLDVQTGNGDITAEMIGFTDSTTVELVASNGAITLQIPKSAAAALEASTQSGTITTEGLDLEDRTEEKRSAGGRLAATLGDGTGRITLRTENGAVTVTGN